MEGAVPVKPVYCFTYVSFLLKYLSLVNPGYDQFGISRRGPEDITDEQCTIFYDKEKVSD